MKTTFAFKLFASPTTRIIISIQLQIKHYMTNKTWLSNIPLIHANTHEYAMVVLSLRYFQKWRPPLPVYTSVVTPFYKFEVIQWMSFECKRITIAMISLSRYTSFLTKG
jgi:hypothetical protein